MLFRSATDELLYAINDSVLIFAKVADDVNVSAVIANVTDPSSVSVILSLSFNSLLARYEGYYNDTDDVGTYTAIIIANDTSNNINATESITFKVVRPNITATKSNSPNPVDRKSVV